MNVESKFDRRQFLAATTVGTGLLGTSALSANAEAATESITTEPLLKSGSTILFQGDSITDVHRDRSIAEANHAKAMGAGYPFLVAAQTLINRPDDELKFFNRGVSGNKVHQLAARWQQDCLDLKPDVVSILIGVNDIWHWLNGKYDGTIETYRTDYHALAERTKQALPGVKLVICEPFVLKTGAVGDKWFPKFNEFRAAAKAVADKHADVWVPFQSAMNAAEKFAPAPIWAGDGVHPSKEGAAMLANTWLRAVNG